MNDFVILYHLIFNWSLFYHVKTILIDDIKDIKDSIKLAASDTKGLDRLIGAAVCGEGLFSLSNDPIVRNQDIEYNRIKLREQLEKGEVQFEISNLKTK